MNQSKILNTGILILVAALLGCEPEATISPDGTAGLSPEAAGAKKVGDAYVAAVNRGDAPAAISCWTEDGEHVNETTGFVTGRAALGKALREAASGDSQTHAEVTSLEFQLVASGVVVERGLSRFMPEEGPPENSRYIAMYVKRDGQWKIHRVWKTELPVASHYEHLAGLSWMIGEWDEEEDGQKTKNVCRWTKNRNFLTRTYKVEAKGKVLITGTEVIGWDPAEKRVRSWTFDSRGGFAEGIWRVKGAQWRPVEVVDVEPADLVKHQTALKKMDWLIGEWADEQAVFKTTCRWSENKVFLVQKFKVSIKGLPDQEGIRIFGLDPDLERPRSWMFDTDGGFAESTWARSGTDNEWQAKTRHVLPDGRLGSSIGICRKIDNDTVSWQRISQELDGEMQPNGPMVTQVRQLTPKETKKTR